jgi:hypothetical protein
MMAMDRHDSSLARTVMVVGVVVSLSDMGVVVARDFVALRQ